jgi:outer membrane lipoprotein-sorting protein
MDLRYTFILFVFLFNAFGSYAQSNTALSILNSMLTACDNVKTVTYKLKQEERFNGKMIYGEQDVKLLVSPFKVYMYTHAPNKGAEVLWVEGQNDGDALVSPNTFPYINLNLDPYGSILRKNQHHALFSSGFGMLTNIIRHGMKKAGDDFDKYFVYDGDIEWDGYSCYKINIEYDQYAIENYTVKNGQTLVEIADELAVCDYMLIELNEDVDDYDDISEAQIIKVPNVYAKKNIIYIDKSTNLPVMEEMHDNDGLFERYRLYNIRINPVIKEEEFTEDFSEYGF